MSLCVCTLNFHCTAFSICPLYVICHAPGLNSFFSCRLFLPSATSCALLDLIQVEFISRELFKRKYMKYSFGERGGRNRAGWIDQLPWLSNPVSLSLKDIDGILTGWSLFQWKETCYSIDYNSIVHLNVSLINLSHRLFCDTYAITSVLCYCYNLFIFSVHI